MTVWKIKFCPMFWFVSRRTTSADQQLQSHEGGFTQKKCLVRRETNQNEGRCFSLFFYLCLTDQFNMEARIQITASLSLSELASQIRARFSKKQREKLAILIQKEEDNEPSTEQILSDLKEDYIALQKGTLKTRPVDEFLKELGNEGYL